MLLKEIVQGTCPEEKIIYILIKPYLSYLVAGFSQLKT